MPPRKKVVPAATATTTESAPPATEDDGMGIDQYELPKSVIARLAKSSVPPEVKLQKEVPIALVKSSTVFINYLAALSHDLATEKGTKTIAALHVLEATKQLGWEDGGKSLEKELKKELKGNNNSPISIFFPLLEISFRKIQEKKKNGTYVAPPSRGAQTSSARTTKSKPIEKEATTEGENEAGTEGEQEEAQGGGGGPSTAAGEGVTMIRDDDGPNQEEEDLYPGQGEDVELYSEGEGDEEEEEGEEEFDGADGVEEPEGAVDLVELDDVDDDEED
ncbi:hypothetical protein JCM5350_005752 [Sporobolomyces pararoseus]